MVARAGEPKALALEAWAFTVPTDAPGSDGTLEWDSTTALVVELDVGGVRGPGYTHAAAVGLVASDLADVLLGRDPLRVEMAISACDAALWDLEARLLGRALVDLLGRVRDEVPAYGSGGFCSCDLPALRRQLGAWAARRGTLAPGRAGPGLGLDLRRADVGRYGCPVDRDDALASRAGAR